MEAVIYYKNGFVIVPINNQEDLEQLLRSLKTINPKHENIKLAVKDET